MEGISEKVVVSGYEVSQVPERTAAGGPSPAARLTPAIPWWARAGLCVVTLCFPLLCVITIVLRIAFRNETPRIKYAWTGFLNTLLMVSGMILLLTATTGYYLTPVPMVNGTGLADLDERASFPTLPSAEPMTSMDVSKQLKPLVVVVSPVARRWGMGEAPSNVFGAGELLHADKDGYLFVTAKHVAQPPAAGLGGNPSHVMLATREGTWGTADIIGTADDLDLALLWLPRHSGSLAFTQPLTTIGDGAGIFVIGHPEGLRFTLSTGIVSGFRDQEIQITAAVSPGNSGGPVYDDHGRLAGIVSAKFDHNRDANAENLSFAVKPAALMTPDAWRFAKGGRVRLESYIRALKAAKIGL